ncbi:hypothetical protein AMECASPLE_026372, partial [Ameca splendens]
KSQTWLSVQADMTYVEGTKMQTNATDVIMNNNKKKRNVPNTGLENKNKNQKSRWVTQRSSRTDPEFRAKTQVAPEDSDDCETCAVGPGEVQEAGGDSRGRVQ